MRAPQYDLVTLHHCPKRQDSNFPILKKKKKRSGIIPNDCCQDINEDEENEQLIGFCYSSFTIIFYCSYFLFHIVVSSLNKLAY